MKPAPKIESGIPVPPRSKWADVLTKMKIGDSIVVTTTEASSVRAQSFKVGVELVSRTIEPNTVRVWRTG